MVTRDQVFNTLFDGFCRKGKVHQIELDEHVNRVKFSAVYVCLEWRRRREVVVD